VAVYLGDYKLVAGSGASSAPRRAWPSIPARASVVAQPRLAWPAGRRFCHGILCAVRCVALRCLASHFFSLGLGFRV
jgi:hypothetical protein